MEKRELLERIVMNPKVMVGKPIVRGTRLTVQHILRLLAQGATTQDILEEYDGLCIEDIHACLMFATETLDSTEFFSLVEVV